VCSAFGDDCPHNPFSNAALPNRLPLERMRSVDSFTLLSFGVIFTGLPVNAPKTSWESAPMLFDYAHAAGISTAYWSAHHPAFAHSHAWTDREPIDRLAWATDFDPSANEVLGADDAVVVDRAIAELPTLREPFFAVVHFAGTHYPYRVDDPAPFQPSSSKLDRADATPLRNRYFSAVLRQDRSTARLVEAVRAMPASSRTLIVFVSDHGESFYEHQFVLHGSSLLDQELRVPAWIDAPPGALSDAERASLRARRDVPVTHVDLAPTMLDLLGIHGRPEWAQFTAKMVGTSLLRGTYQERPVTITTCNDLSPCFVPSWGKLIGDRKWLYHPLDPTFRCFDTRRDPAEEHDLGRSACGQ
jgi:glucan phosphoethanolaminetransferase (alkaline phosphatase superfamily)